MEEIPYGYCKCGCGQKTKIATRTVNKKQIYKGRPLRYIEGHANRRNEAERKAEFWSKVDIRGEEECWEWKGKANIKEYGVFSMSNKNHYAHRLSFLWAGGELSEEKDCVCHHCDNPKCVNPKHLFAGNRADNDSDRDAKGRHADQKGSKNNQAKTTEEDVVKMRELHKNGMPTGAIAKRYALKHATVYAIIKMVNWKNVQE